MKIDNFISSCFPSKNNLVLPKNNDLPKLKKTWGKVIDDFTKDFGPKTKEAKNIIEKAKKKEEEIENERLKVQRIKIDAENKLRLAEEEDQKNLQKILSKYQGENLEKELNRLGELPIESLTLVEKDEKFVESPVADTLRVNATAITYSANTPSEGPYYSPRESEEVEISKSKKHKPLPWLVIFTQPLKTLPPTDEELKHFKLVKRRQIKSWAGRDIGRFVILLDLENLNRSHLTVYNLDKQTDDIYDHACINEGSVCFGNRSESYDLLAKKYQIFDMVDMIFDLLQSVATARPYSYPHCEWDKWFERSEKIDTEKVYEKIKSILKTKRRVSNGSGPMLAEAFAQQYVGWDPAASQPNGAGYHETSGSNITIGSTTTISDPSQVLDNESSSMVQSEVQNYLRLLENRLQESRAREEMERSRANLMQSQMAQGLNPDVRNEILNMLAPEENAEAEESNGL